MDALRNQSRAPGSRACDAQTPVADAGRDFSAIETTAYPPPNQLAKCGGDHRRMIEEYRAAGAHRMVLGPATLEPAKVERALENLARKVLVWGLTPAQESGNGPL